MNKKFHPKLSQLNTPWKIQEAVSKIPYNPEDFAHSAESVFVAQKAHCFEGALLACLALEKLGHQPQMLHLRSHRDDDHVVAIFQEKKKWGAIGKSNTTLLAWRNPVYPTLEALAMSYFPFYFNTKGQMSLIAWAGPIALSRYEKKWNWRNGLGDISDMSADFYKEKSRPVMSKTQIEKLPKANPRLVSACFLGANTKGLYKA